MEIFKCFHFNLLLLATFSVFFLAVVSEIDPYSDALLSLKSELVDDDNSLSDWIMIPSGSNSTGKSNASSYCSWSGIKCDNSSKTVITSIDLSMKKLGGVISGKQFNVFTKLEYLNLSHNFFSGNLPMGIFNLTSLRILDIRRNNFSGNFPDGISRLKNLLVLDAFSNSFSGSLPVELPQLENLKVLNLAGSYFKGPIPSQYGSFRSLQFLHLAGNLLSGNLPPELGNLKTVSHMEIGYNSYLGFIPSEFGNMSELKYLDIAGANLSGSIPKEISNLTNLQSLYLFRNQLIGPIPSEFSNIKSLTDLDLSDNFISGPIPESFSELKNLKLLSLMYNDMNGTVPEGIAELPNLESLLIWNNDFSGSLPKSLGKNSNLMWVDVSTNNFVGTIPPDICIRGVLYKLILFSNRFSGSFSPSLSNCSSLVRLRLEDNLFTGKIPLKFRNLPALSYVDLSGNKFLGGIPSDISQATKLTYFNVSYNPQLGGIIPTKTWSLPLLQNFSASSCGISGNLPTFESCKSVSTIDLSHNNLTGPIPEKFSTCSSLQLLNVSFNYISGSIPEGKLFRFMDTSAFAGNPELCGAPLRPCSDSVGILGSKGTWKLTSVVLLCAGLVIFLVAALAFGIVYFRRGVKSQWKMISFVGLPQFTANDVLTSFDTKESSKPESPSVSKAVLPTGITVLVKKIEWEKKNIKVVSEFIMSLGNARHKNLIRLLGFCYNQNLAYVLYDYLPNGNLAEKIGIKRDWEAKFRIVIGIAKGLCFLHHDCYPAIPHGDLKCSNVVFDENMEPHLAEFGLKHVLKLSKGSCPATTSSWEPEYNEAMKEELKTDVYKFGEMILEILTNGRLKNAEAAAIIQSKPKEVLLREIYDENDLSSVNSLQEMKLVLEVALLCTRNKSSSDLPSMEDALKLLLGSKLPEDHKY